ncbi:dihydrofolate reductase family protein [Gordonia sp. PKS22-38]|uniref:Dihydrofolate reductase family protein n=1 Tax=Gordonia prachuapensis TaxID=3115651 RepID=A0ABU7MZJ9_9ACTN|nr:dihydrofolate reductase family protein [Gordonia sp. PKS22-38]
MRTLIVTEFISLDGVIDSPGGGDHPRAGWTFTDIDFVEEAYEIKGREQQEAGALLIGRVSYEEFAPVWPSMDEFAEYNAMPKYVVSSTLTDPDWNNTSVLRSLDDVARLKEGDGGNILVHGSATLAQGLAAAGLVDRYHLLVFPVVLGSGKRLFADDPAEATSRLSLVEHEAYTNGVVKAVYDVVRADSGDVAQRAGSEAAVG